MRPAESAGTSLLEEAADRERRHLLRLRIVLSFILATALCALPALAQTAPTAGSGTALLQYKFKAGDIDRYKMVVKMDMNIAIPGMPATMSGGMAAQTSMVSILRAKVLGILPNGNAKVQYTYESMKMDMNMPGMPPIEKDKMDQMQGDLVKQMPVITATLTKYGQIVSIEGMDKMPGMKQGANFDKLFGGQMGFGLGTGSVIFPSEPVGIGDAWTQDIPIMGAGRMTVDSTVESLNAKIGDKVGAKIKQDYYGHMEIADLMKAMLPAMGGTSGSGQIPAMKGGMDMSGWGVAYADPDKGKLIRSDADVNMVMNMTATAPASAAATGMAPGQPINIGMKMNMKINIITLPN
jgi:hypothetical protein